MDMKSHAVEATPGTLYTCPMHPEIRQDHPGNCPKCGMTLEPVLPELDEADNPELVDFKRRFWWTLPLTAIVTLLAMVGHRLGCFDMARQSWIELVLSLPMIAALAMSLSSAAVITNALRLRSAALKQG
jgi:P-type Cu+ transporter